MANLPTQVQPGDVVSADLMNAILAAIAGLQGTPGGSQTVPNLFGAFLSDARAILQQPQRQLTLGFTLDVTGASVDPLSSANAHLIVLNQSPPADSRVAPSTPVNLVVSQSTSFSPTPAPPPPPTITRTESSGGVAGTSFAVGSTFAIVGNNFNVNPALNTVTFNNVAASAVTSDLTSPTQRILVTVPTGIPNAPVNSGDAPLANVTVRVSTPNSQPATTTVTLTAPVANQPTITSVSPSSQFERSNITITGTNFGSAPAVKIRSVSATVVSASATQIVVTVPDFSDVQPGPPVPASIVVTVQGAGDVTFSGNFLVRGLA